MKYLVPLITGVCCVSSAIVLAQDTVHYTGKQLVNIDYHHGRLSPAIGVHNIQTFRANRGDTGVASWTYNHAPMLACWNKQFYLEYLSNPVGEHVPPGRTLLQRSTDGYHWTQPEVIFPPYKVPDGFVKKGRTDTAKNAYAVMHQRIGFYTSAGNRLFALGFYGVVLGAKDDPNDGNGIGRVIREIKKDGAFGPIYFLRYNHAFSEKNTDYPFYRSSPDRDFVQACETLLHTPLLMLQTVEEADKDDPLVPLQKDHKAFNYYHLADGRVVGLWKYALTSISKDQGKTWQYPPLRAPGFVNANAKIWGQRTSDGRYATVYNPSEFRWPLAVSVSPNGLGYQNLLLVNGEISSMRYGGAYKSYGPQYVRGIQEMDGKPADGNLWVSYSMNKEDIWISKIPVPVKEKASGEANDVFDRMTGGNELAEWNIFSPLWCRTSIEQYQGKKVLALRDSDPFDYAKAERVFPAAGKRTLEVTLTPVQDSHGRLEIEWQDANGTPCLRLMLDSAGNLLTKQGYRNKSLGKYRAGETLVIRIELNTASRMYTVTVNNGKPSLNLCFAPVTSVERLVFRTGGVRHFPDAETPTDQDYDLPGADRREKEALYYIHAVKTIGQ
ncbi:exo-alpha-sialidase [Sediminibacterium soli]|uniref:exo-alpha-sialidase n=1 Tax=Sediminibacterium soli TaxID=2698829 RepID=UPI0013798911|nr:exo-alpha-sialidase [Sediminibacterium soli]NCI48182.1 six-hairpin glycosidase [Sediminibacterium soli]